MKKKKKNEIDRDGGDGAGAADGCALIAPDDGQAFSRDNCTLFHVADFARRGRNLLYG